MLHRRLLSACSHVHTVAFLSCRQWLDCVWQLLRQAPSSFEFNAQFLRHVAQQALSGRYGTFAGNCAAQRVAARLRERTVSLWADVAADPSPFVNVGHLPRADPLFPHLHARSLALWQWHTQWDPSARLTAEEGNTALAVMLPLLARLDAEADVREKDVQRAAWPTGKLPRTRVERLRLLHALPVPCSLLVHSEPSAAHASAERELGLRLSEGDAPVAVESEASDAASASGVDVARVGTTRSATAGGRGGIPLVSGGTRNECAVRGEQKPSFGPRRLKWTAFAYLTPGARAMRARARLPLGTGAPVAAECVASVQLQVRQRQAGATAAASAAHVAMLKLRRRSAVAAATEAAALAAGAGEGSKGVASTLVRVAACQRPCGQ